MPFPVLLIDDDLDDQYFIKIAVYEINPLINLKVVDDGAEALNYLTKVSKRIKFRELPRLIITDINMPRLDGFEFLRKIKGVEPLKDIPIVVLSTATEPGTMNRIMEMGAVKYYNKPVDPSEFKSIIEEMINLIFSDK